MGCCIVSQEDFESASSRNAKREQARGWPRVVIVCGTSHSSGGQWAPRDEDVRQEVLLRGGGGGVMGYLQSLVGTAPGSLIGTVLQSGSRFPGRRARVIAVASPPYPPLHPDPPRGGRSYMCVRLTRLDPETES